MEPQIFKAGDRVRPSKGGEAFTIKEAHYMYVPNRKGWQYTLDDGSKYWEDELAAVAAPKKRKEKKKSKRKISA